MLLESHSLLKIKYALPFFSFHKTDILLIPSILGILHILANFCDLVLQIILF